MDRIENDITQRSNRKNSQRVMWLIGLALCLPVTSYAQEGESQKKVKGASLEISLRMPVSTLCVSTSTLLEMEVINVSRKEITLDKVDLWNQFSYSYTNPSYNDPNAGPGRGGGQGTGCSHCRGNTITLYPGTNYWAIHSFPLDTDFFKDPGNYTLRTSINSIASNDVEFTLIDCGKK